jgi:hypothetical protein
MTVADLHISYITLSYYALSIVADDDSGKFLGLRSNAEMQGTLCIPYFQELIILPADLGVG